MKRQEADRRAPVSIGMEPVNPLLAKTLPGRAAEALHAGRPRANRGQSEDTVAQIRLTPDREG